MVRGDEELDVSPLFLACTRPAMIGGVTMEAMGFNVILTNILFLALGSIKYAIVGVVIHFIFRMILRHDHNAFRVLVAWIDTRGRQKNVGYWGGSTVTPLCVKRRYDERDFGDA